MFGRHLPCVPLHERRQGKFLVEIRRVLVRKELQQDYLDYFAMEICCSTYFLFCLVRNESSV